MVSQLMNLTGHEPVADDLDAIYYEGNKAPKSLELTVKLDNLTSTAPPYELWNPKRGPAPSTTKTYSILSNTTYEIGVKSNFDSSAGKETEILLGAIFLSATYLFVDLEAGTFKLAPTKPTASSTRELQPICPVTHDPGSRCDADLEVLRSQSQELHANSTTSPAPSSELARIRERETGLRHIERKANIRVKTEGADSGYGSTCGSPLSSETTGGHGGEGAEMAP
ncbi:hypothetical protein B9Z19DRAFT_1069818 [Tuber borchii]|uniref:Uncharacterized protein n=1 Tax=Tuber borchii TaxID=42251 RepID=A0A2T6ZA49_TUBBO|nr:hypothetical protein B9Z19DRAFT_1069818 [Tuber borchii]